MAYKFEVVYKDKDGERVARRGVTETQAFLYIEMQRAEGADGRFTINPLPEENDAPASKKDKSAAGKLSSLESQAITG